MSQRARVLVWIADGEMRNRMVAVVNRLSEFQGTEYRNGAGQFEDLYMQRPNCILMDADYAVRDVDAAVREIRKNLPGVALVGLSYRWDELKRKQMVGLFDSLLVMPFDTDSINRALVEAQSNVSTANNKCEVMAFFAPKGKSGRTTLIVNLAMALARASGERVGIIDAETNFADMEAFLNLNPQSTIVEAMRDLQYLTPNTLNRYFEEVNTNVHVMCGARTPQQAAFIDAAGLTKLINLAKKNFSYLLIDIAPGFNNISIAACEAADRAYITIMSGGAFEMQNLEKSLEIFHSLDNWKQRVSCVITRMQPDVHKRIELEDKFGTTVTLLPNEYMLCSQAANNGRMAMDIGPQSPLTQQIDMMAKAIVEAGR